MRQALRVVPTAPFLRLLPVCMCQEELSEKTPPFGHCAFQSSPARSLVVAEGHAAILDVPGNFSRCQDEKGDRTNQQGDETESDAGRTEKRCRSDRFFADREVLCEQYGPFPCC